LEEAATGFSIASGQEKSAPEETKEPANDNKKAKKAKAVGI
jgi:hypothetical protein